MTRCLCPACCDHPAPTYSPAYLLQCDARDWRQRFLEIAVHEGHSAAVAWWRKTRTGIEKFRGEHGLAELENLIRSET